MSKTRKYKVIVQPWQLIKETSLETVIKDGGYSIFLSKIEAMRFSRGSDPLSLEDSDFVRRPKGKPYTSKISQRMYDRLRENRTIFFNKRPPSRNKKSKR